MRAAIVKGVAIASARRQDAPALAAFQTLVWEQTYRGVITDDVLDAQAEGRAARWADRLSSGSRAVTIAWADDSIAGVASTSSEHPPRAGLPPLELSTLYLRRDAQGAGLGSHLLYAAIGDDDAHLLSFEVNARARRFYEQHGFTPENELLLDSGTGLTERRWVRRRGVDRSP